MNLKEHETIDDLQREGLKIIQNNQWFKFGIDAVLLAHFARSKNAKKIIDLGTGTGIIPLLLSSTCQHAHITGVEIQEDVADMAKRSVILNGLSSKINILNADIKQLEHTFNKQTFDIVISNPPYFKARGGIENINPHKRISRHEVACQLEDIYKSAHHLLIPNGSLYMIHRPDRLVDIISLARLYRLEPKIIQFIQPQIGKSPNLVLIKCIKYANPELNIKPAIIVYNEDGSYSNTIYSIYQQTHLTAFSKGE